MKEDIHYIDYQVYKKNFFFNKILYNYQFATYGDFTFDVTCYHSKILYILLFDNSHLYRLTHLFITQRKKDVIFRIFIGDIGKRKATKTVQRTCQQKNCMFDSFFKFIATFFFLFYKKLFCTSKKSIGISRYKESKKNFLFSTLYLKNQS